MIADKTAIAVKNLTDGQCVGLALRKATRRITRAYDEALARHDLTIGQLGILAAVASRAGWSVQELADLFDMNQSAMSRTLQPLIREGLLEDRVASDDRRRRGLTLTEMGGLKLSDAAATWQGVQDRIAETSQLDRDHLLGLLRSLRIVDQAVDSTDQGK